MAPITDEKQENRLGWWGRILRRDEVEAFIMQFKTREWKEKMKVRPKKTWIWMVLESDMKIIEVCEEDENDQNK